MEEYLKKLVEKIEDKVVVLFGEPFVGKTTFAKEIRKFFEQTVWFKVDRNYDKKELEDQVNTLVFDIASWKEAEARLDELLEKTREKPKEDKWLLVIDSLSTLATDFLKDRINSPRRNNELAAFYDRVLQKLSVLKERGITGLVIVHEALKKFPDLIAPRMNVNALRHVDLVLRAYFKENGARALKVWRERKNPENPKFFIELE